MTPRTLTQGASTCNRLGLYTWASPWQTAVGAGVAGTGIAVAGAGVAATAAVGLTFAGWLGVATQPRAARTTAHARTDTSLIACSPVASAQPCSQGSHSGGLGAWLVCAGGRTHEAASWVVDMAFSYMAASESCRRDLVVSAGRSSCIIAYGLRSNCDAQSQPVPRPFSYATCTTLAAALKRMSW